MRQYRKEDTPLFSSSLVEEPAPPRPLSVSGLTSAIKSVLETAFTEVSVEGEITGFKAASGGHRYFNLKDESAVINCTLWKSRIINFDIADGMTVQCRGRISVYPPRGSYNLDIFQIRPVGIGALQQAFERLMQKLSAEGIFDASRKRPIPQFPKKIGIVTSGTGAALHDILTVLRRRYPLTSVLLRASSVQGTGSELQIAQAIKDLNQLPEDYRPDVLIVGRGGGSLEDLWSFNEEAVARAIYASGIPVISAVGHEVDVTIADMVADLRAPTPTAAAELATPDKNELLGALSALSDNLYSTASYRIERLQNEFTSHLSGYAMRRCLLELIEQKRTVTERAASAMRSGLERRIEIADLRVQKFSASLQALDPKNVLARGYAIAMTEDGKVISAANDVPDTAFRLTLKEGSVKVQKTN